MRTGDLKVLVATSVGEEGLDVPSVDPVVFYEPVPSGVRYIQRKGRTGRKSKGKAIILVTEETHDATYLKVSEKRRKKMKTVVEGLNTKLEKMERKIPQLEKNPMPREIIAEAEKYSPPKKRKSPRPKSGWGRGQNHPNWRRKRKNTWRKNGRKSLEETFYYFRDIYRYYL
ncbi:hypothetical protein AKJ40_02875 [candidate division MSBL1 archaeon SCGC-AAA259M10]|uniref:Helicase C-terminal domain-containing protein n=1 Tax=candidate division MSBL1 archaeon SCGC-AAA259M10 TaxID=1698270 RepID=A0A133UZD5_9EURY|nr:hypothetical protein AKJ40_02875 [candidate division MSBL1 archaeon SCGC-AAA259M10]